MLQEKEILSILIDPKAEIGRLHTMNVESLQNLVENTITEKEAFERYEITVPDNITMFVMGIMLNNGPWVIKKIGKEKIGLQRKWLHSQGKENLPIGAEEKVLEVTSKTFLESYNVLKEIIGVKNNPNAI